MRHEPTRSTGPRRRPSVWALHKALGGGWFHIGYTAVQSVEGLSKALEGSTLSYSRATGAPILGGGGGYLGRIFIGGKGEALLGSKITGGVGAGRVGFFWRVGQRLLVLPTVGVGGGGYTLYVSGRPSEVQFSQAIDSTGGIPPRSFSTSGPMGEISVALKYFSQKGYLIGLEVGYLRGLGEFSQWRTGGIDLQGGPKITPQRLSVRLLIGGGVISQRGE